MLCLDCYSLVIGVGTLSKHIILWSSFWTKDKLSFTFGRTDFLPANPLPRLPGYVMSCDHSWLLHTFHNCGQIRFVLPNEEGWEKPLSLQTSHQISHNQFSQETCYLLFTGNCVINDSFSGNWCFNKHWQQPSPRLERPQSLPAFSQSSMSGPMYSWSSHLLFLWKVTDK